MRLAGDLYAANSKSPVVSKSFRPFVSGRWWRYLLIPFLVWLAASPVVATLPPATGGVVPAVEEDGGDMALEATDDEAVVGMTPGHFQVDTNGAANYTIPLTVPPGTGGLQPNLQLAYNHQAGNGISGVGWALTGLSKIERCPATDAQDGFNCGVHFDGNDRFCLDGQRLIRVDEPQADGGECLVEPDGDLYFEDGAIYHTEKESWSRVVAVGTCVSGPCGFVVTRQDGSTLEFGSPQVDSDAADPSGARVWAVDATDTETRLGVRVWALNRQTDTTGNSLTASYTQAPLGDGDAEAGDDSPFYPCNDSDDTSGDPGATDYAGDPASEFYPCRIDYTANDGTVPAACTDQTGDQLAAQRSVVFGYGQRPAEDIPWKFVGGAQVRTEARAVAYQTQIVAEGETTESEVETYALTYDDSGDRMTYRSRLVEIQQCAQGACFDGPTSLSFLKEEFDLESLVDDSSMVCDADLSWNDYNGDGRSDWICTDAAAGEVEVYLSTGDGFTTGGQVSGPELPDVTPCTGSGNARVDWGDFDGDGRDDWLCYQYNDDSSVSDQEIRVLLSSDDGLVDEGITAQPFCTSEWQWSDFNADGRIDWVCWDADADDSVYVLLATVSGDSYGLEAPAGADIDGAIYSGSAADCSGDNEAVAWDDIDGDGLEDWICYQNSGSPVASVLLSTGQTLVSGPSLDDSSSTGSSCGCGDSVEVTWQDFNGDQLADWICTCNDGSAGLGVRLSTGTAFVDPSTGSWPSASPTCDGSSGGEIDWIDFNADGMSDWICSGVGTVQVLISTGDDLTSVSSGAGGSNSTIDNNDVTCDLSGGESLDWADFTGQGLADWICSDAEDGTVTIYSQPSTSTNAGVTSYPDLVNTFTNGFGGTYVIEYQPLSGSDVYTLSSDDSDGTNAQRLLNGLANGQYPMAPVASSLYVVAEYEEGDGQGHTYDYSYHYSNAKIDMDGYGWLGFETVTRDDVQLGTSTVTTFNQDFPFDGTVVTVEVAGCDASVNDLGCGGETCTAADATLSNLYVDYCCLGEDPSSCDTTVCCDAGSGDDASCSDGEIFQPYPGVYQVLPTLRRSDTYSYGTYLFSLGVQTAYDTFGNATLSSNWGYVDQDWDAADLEQGTTDWNLTTDDDVFTAVDYFDVAEDVADGTWFVGFPTTTTVSDTSGVLKQSQLYYDVPADDVTTQSPCGLSCTPAGTMKTVCRSFWRDQAGGSCGSDDLWLNTTYQFDSFGNGVAVTDPNGQTTTTAYETTYNTFPQAVTTPKDADGTALTTTFAYDAAFGRRIATTDANGNTLITCLDEFGRPTARQGPIPDNAGDVPAESNCLPSSVAASTEVVVNLALLSWDRDDAGNPFHQTARRNTWSQDTVDADARSATSFIDGLDRVYRKVTSGTSANPIYVDTDFFTTSLRSSETVPYYDGDTVYATTRCYDSNGWLRQSTEPYLDDSTTTTTWTYSGAGSTDGSQGLPYVSTSETQATGTDDAWQQTTDSVYANGRQVVESVTYANDDDAVTDFTYDALARRLTVEDPIGAGNTVTYNSLDQRLTVDDSDAGQHSLCFDDDGHLAQITDSMEQVAAFTYDNLNRKISKTLTSSGTVQKVVTYAYDSDDQTNALGHLSSLLIDDTQDDCGDLSESFDYDDYGKIDTRTITLPDPGDASCASQTPFTTERQRDPQGRTTTYVYPDGVSTLTRSFQSNGFLQAQQLDDASGEELRIEYDDYTALGQAQTLLYGEADDPSAQESLTMTPLGHRTGQQVAVGSSNLLDDTYTWDRLWSLQALTTGDGSGDASNGYDDDDGVNVWRLMSDADHAYNYDQGGNLIAIDDVDYTYNSGTHQVIDASDDQFAASYDGDGNMSRRTGSDGVDWSFTYDVENRLIAADGSDDDGTYASSYDYDDRGRRVRKVESDGTLVTYVTSTYEITTSGGVQSVSKYINDHGDPVASVASSGSDDSISLLYFHRNPVNSVVLATDAEGAVAASLVYDSWGGIDGDASSGADSLRYTFGDRELDGDTGLYYFRARYYDPEVGRFLTADTRLGAGPHRQDTYNRYAFVLNNPYSYSDPSGHNIFTSYAKYWKHSYEKEGKWLYGKAKSGVTSVAKDARNFVTADIQGQIGFYKTLATHPFSGKAWKKWATSTGGEVMITSGISLAEIAGGIALDNPSLLGAGTSGLMYTATHADKSFSYRDWAGAEIAGAVSGYVGGMAPEGASFATTLGYKFAGGVAGSVASNTFQQISHGKIPAAQPMSALLAGGKKVGIAIATGSAKEVFNTVKSEVESIQGGFEDDPEIEMTTFESDIE